MTQLKQRILKRMGHKYSGRAEQRMKAHSTFSIEAAIEALHSQDGFVRQDARRSLVARGSVAVEPLIALLRSSNSPVRWEAAKALTEIETPKAADALVSALSDENRDVRWLAAEGLVQLGHHALIPLLHGLITDTDSIYVREGATHVLHSLVDEEDVKIVAPVLDALEDGAPLAAVPVAAHEALEAIRKLHPVSLGH